MSAAAVEPRRLRALFDELADLPEAEAERRLAQDLAGEPALREALRGLLLADRGAEGAGPIPRDLTGGARWTEPAAPDPARLGRFHVLRRLGQGGMGVVYDAYDEVLDRRVALKLLAGSPSEHALLLREARALARLAHPNVVPIYEVGAHEGRPFIAMERVEGQPLSEWLERPGLQPGDKLRLLLQAGRALSAAHDSGVIHRDFKPQNVLVGADGRPRVLDFGIAALRGRPAAPGEGEGDAAQRGPGAEATVGALRGTPAYMAPEQLRAGEVTPLCDQFAFGVVLYRAVYGQAPFAGDELPALRESVLAGALRPPPRRADVPDWLWPIVARALALDPAARFPTLDALLRAIEAHLPPDPRDDPAPTRLARARMIVAYLACALVLAVVAHLHGPRDLMGTHGRVVAIAAGLLAVVAGLLGLSWRSLSETSHGRRSGLFFLLLVAALLLHRLLGWRMGTAVPDILAADLLLLSSLLGCGALLLDRWLAVSALLLGAAAAAAAWDGRLGAVLFPLVGPASTALVLWRTLRR